MNILIDLVPDTVLVDNVKYKINSDFRIGILFEMLMQDSGLSDDEKGRIALELYYPEIPHDLGHAVNKMLWFYRCGRDLEIEKGTGEGESAKAIYSFEHDAEYIYSAFLSQYNIDLQDIDYLHWWKFKAMFKGLKEDNQISKIMGFRAMKIDKDMTDGEKKYYREMKKIYALPDERTEEEKERDFENAIYSLM